MSLASRSIVDRSGSGDPEIPLSPLELDDEEEPLPLDALPPPPRSRLKMDGSEADLDVELLAEEEEDAPVWTATTEAAMAVVVAGMLEGLCSLLERSRSQNRWNLERGFGLDASAGRVALRLTGGWTPVPTGGSGVLRLFRNGKNKTKTKMNEMIVCKKQEEELDKVAEKTLTALSMIHLLISFQIKTYRSMTACCCWTAKE
jgi:hypothetical protein